MGKNAEFEKLGFGKADMGGSEGQIRESLSLGNQKHKNIDDLL